MISLNPMKRMIVLACAAVLALLISDAQAEMDAKGGYLEIGGVFMAPYSGEQLAVVDPGFGSNRIEVEPGGGFQFAGGYGFGLVSIGTRLFYVFLPQEGAGSGGLQPVPNSSLEADLFAMDLEARIFPLGSADSRLQPYALAGIGWGVFNGDFKEGEAIWTLNFGIGLQMLLTEHVYLAVEGAYRPLFGVDPCGFTQELGFLPAYSCDGGEDMHVATGTASLGFRF